MVFILQNSVYDTIHTDITTKSGKRSLSNQLKHYYIIHRLNYYKVFRKDEYLKGVPMNAQILSNLFGNGSIVKRVLTELIQMNFITKVKESKLNISSARYILNESIANERVYQPDFNSFDSALIQKLEIKNLAIKDSFKGQFSMLNEYVSLNELGKSYLIKKYGVLPSSDNNVAIDSTDLGLVHILLKNFFSVRPDIKSRVYTNLTSLSRNHRKYIEIKDRPMLMTDISNSQILLTVPLLHKFWAKNSGKGLFNLPDDINAFQKLAESGMFYEYIAESAGRILTNADDRADFKKQVFAEIWFSKNSKRLTAIKRVFKSQFPTVFDIIWKLKEEKHNEFAIKLQQFEASILVDKVWKKMFKLGRVVFTLHDAIICNNNCDLELAENLIKDELIKYRIEPKFKREDVDLIAA